MSIISLVFHNLARNRRNLAVCAIGLVVGVASFVFFFALGAGVKRVVLEEVFVIKQVEVVPRQFDLAMSRVSIIKLDEGAIDKFSQIPNVINVYPKMKFTFPAWATGGKEILGKNFRAEVIADGIPPRLVRDELPKPARFVDWDAEFVCGHMGAACPPGQECIGGFCRKKACDPDRYDACPHPSYCVRDTQTCDMPVPILVHPSLLNVYNSGLATALSAGPSVALPKLTPQALEGFIFDVELGVSYLGDSAQGEPKSRRMQCVGVSDRAIDVGFTMPIGYVQRFNAYFSGDRESREYHSIVLEARRNEDVAGISKAVRAMGFALAEKHVQAERIGLVITIITLLFSLISLLIMLISATNIAQTFFMIVAERQREIGILRALGASRSQIGGMMLAEGTIVGLIGTLLGLGVAQLCMWAIDGAFVAWVPDFPFKPASLFVVEGWVLAVAVLGGVTFCLLGALFPALRAAHVDPARVFNR